MSNGLVVSGGLVVSEDLVVSVCLLVICDPVLSGVWR